MAGNTHSRVNTLSQTVKTAIKDTVSNIRLIGVQMRSFTNLGNHEDEDGHGGRLVGLRDAVVLPVVVVVDGSELRRGQFCKNGEKYD